MGDAAGTEKAFRAGKGAVDELIDDDEVARHQILAQAADRRERDDVGDAAALQRVDIGAEIDLRRRQEMPAPVPRHEHDPLSAEDAEAEFVRGLPERALDPPPGDIGQPVDLVEAAAPDDADHGRAQ